MHTATCTCTNATSEGLGFADLNVEASVDEDDDCAELDVESAHEDEDQGGEAISNVAPSIPLQTPAADNLNLGKNIWRHQDDLVIFGDDFSQPTSDRDEGHYSVGDTNVSYFHFIPPLSQRRRVSIDPHEMHASHVIFWNSSIREEFANRHSHSQQFMQSD